MATLFEQLGGQDPIDAVVDHFYNIMLKDDRVKHFFANTDMMRQRTHQKRFVALALGDPNLYDGKAMRDLNVPENLIAEVAAIVETTRSDVLNK